MGGGKPCKLASDYMSLFEAHDAGIVFATGQGRAPPPPPAPNPHASSRASFLQSGLCEHSVCNCRAAATPSRFVEPCKLASMHMIHFWITSCEHCVCMWARKPWAGLEGQTGWGFILQPYKPPRAGLELVSCLMLVWFRFSSCQSFGVAV